MDDETTPNGCTPGRRALLAGALAGAAAAVVGSGGHAAANDPNDVLLGGVNNAAATTSITFTDKATTEPVLRITRGGAPGGSALEAGGRAVGVLGSGTRAGVHGITSAGAGAGIRGEADDPSGFALGVEGSTRSAQGVGVWGRGPGTGVLGQVGNVYPEVLERRIGVFGRARADASMPGGIGGAFEGARAALWLVPALSTGAPATGEHDVGEIVVDRDGRVFVCRGAGTPGTWVELAAAQPRSTLVVLPTPERFVDTRTGLGGVVGPVAAGTTAEFVMTGRVGERADASLVVPDDATALVGTVSVVSATTAAPGSFVSLWSSGPRPATASITFGPGAIVSTSFLVALADLPTDAGATGAPGHRGINVFVSAACDYVLDVTGYSAMR